MEIMWVHGNYINRLLNRTVYKMFNISKYATNEMGGWENKMKNERNSFGKGRAQNCQSIDRIIFFPDKFIDASSTSVPSPPDPGSLSCASIATDAESGRDSPVDVSSTSESSTPTQSHGETR